MSLTITNQLRERALTYLMENWLNVSPADRAEALADGRSHDIFPGYALVLADQDARHSVELLTDEQQTDMTHGAPYTADTSTLPWQLVDLDTGQITPVRLSVKLGPADGTYDIVPDAAETAAIRADLSF